MAILNNFDTNSAITLVDLIETAMMLRSTREA